MELASTARLPIGRVRAVAVRTIVGLCAGALLLVTFMQLMNVNAVVRRLEHLNIWLALLCSIPFLGAYVVRALR